MLFAFYLNVARARCSRNMENCVSEESSLAPDGCNWRRDKDRRTEKRERGRDCLRGISADDDSLWSILPCPFLSRYPVRLPESLSVCAFSCDTLCYRLHCKWQSTPPTFKHTRTEERARFMVKSDACASLPIYRVLRGWVTGIETTLTMPS